MIEAVVLAFGLAMDGAAVSAARGLVKRRGEQVALPLLFGVFHAGMAGLGWALGAVGGRYVAQWDHWIAFGLLLLIGMKMIIAAVRDGEQDTREGSIGLWLVLALATSIDAAAAGITLPLVPVEPWLSLVLIGVVTATCSLAGYVVGRVIGGPKLAIAGGVILIGLGVRILLDHL